MTLSSSAIQLRQLLVEDLLPWARPDVLRWGVAHAHIDQVVLPAGAEKRPRVMRSRAVSYPARRQYRNTSLIARRWPHDHLSAHRVPKLLCVVSGSPTIELGKYELTLPVGSFLFIPAGTPNPDGSVSHLRPHQMTSSSDICWISPRGGQLHLWVCRSVGREHFTLHWSNAFFYSKRLMPYFDLLQQETQIKKGSPLFISHLLSLLLLSMQREIEKEGFLRLSNQAITMPRSTVQQDPITLAAQYLEANFASAVTIESLARQVGMSRSQLARRFHERTGNTIVEYLTRIRLEHACRFLRETEWTITYIARFVGFRSPAYFHTLFSRQIGSTPGDFRDEFFENRDSKE